MDWKAPHRIELQYKRLLNKVGRFILSEIGQVKTLHDWNKVISKLISSDVFNNFSYLTAQKFVTHVNLDVGRTWREAASASGKGRIVYEALKNELHGHIGVAFNQRITENAQLIKTLPLNIAEMVNSRVSEFSMQGLRASEIADMLKGMTAQYTKSRIETIARTETSKAQSALIEARSRDMGFNWYIWRTSEDARVRSSHAHMDKVLVNWNDAPAPEVLNGMKSEGHYHAGNIYNCRCSPRPVLSHTRLDYPVKVYYNGAIQRMTRAQFENIK